MPQDVRARRRPARLKPNSHAIPAQTYTAQVVPGTPHVNVYNLPSAEPTLGQIISIIGIAIALLVAIGNAIWQSYLQKRQLKQSMYEKRFAVYLGVRKFLSTVATNLQPDLPDSHLLFWETNQAEWLFKSEIEDFIKLLNKNAVRLRHLNQFYTQQRITQPQIDEMNALSEWFCDTAPTMAQQMFAPYLKLS